MLVAMAKNDETFNLSTERRAACGFEIRDFHTCLNFLLFIGIDEFAKTLLEVREVRSCSSSSSIFRLFFLWCSVKML